ncbi:NAD(P)-binding protein [Gonapodya prolifera JEL478]|uniref:NAD(P)-binding protein n=1 Tax=Gonapodya prolifera (strain JEL478) TaxID=1344416 RepID=A0A138ZYK9_GONPJ|nr:NAD(P)-binding protein [Gonapodya prolifera JEL478]|eukprot:KXS09355.1 NAD(P)-binding protein [Gonapodya prolifera JEL478]
MSALPANQKQVLFAKRPGNGVPDPQKTFQTVVRPLRNELKDGEVLIKNIYLSLDPTMRGWMTPDPNSYIPPLQPGQVMRCWTSGVVVHSKDPQFAPGDWVQSNGGWQEYSIEKAKGITKTDRGEGVTLKDSIAILGVTGLTAMCGIFEIGKAKTGELKPGSTVVVSGAAGATGSVAAMIYKRVLGCRVIGIAGGEDKCSWLKNSVGLDVALNYKSATFAKDLKATVGKGGIDEYFDNGGTILELCLENLARNAHIVLCGGISNYNDFGTATGPRNYLRLIVAQAKMHGFVVVYWAHKFPEWRRQLIQWLKEGKVENVVTVVQGIENAPSALNLLWTGGNTGKLMVEVAPEPEASSGAKGKL